MYKVASLGLFAVLAVMIVPATFETTTNEISAFYGYSVMSVKDVSGQTVFENGVHNEVLNQGVEFIQDSVLGGDGVAGLADADQPDGICIDVSGRAMSNLFSTTNETMTFSQFNDNDGNPADDNDNCEGVTFTTGASSGTGVASGVSSTATFNAGGDNLADDQTIVGFVVCEITTAAGQPNCETPLLSAIDTTDVQVGNGETVDITYTMTLD